MDTIRPRKNRKKQYIVLLILFFLSIGFLIYHLATKPKILNVSAKELLIKEVKNDVFQDFMILQAQAVPLESMLINIVEGGSVQELFTENGAMVEKGMPLARLYNPNTEFNFLSQETAIIEQMNNLNVAKLSLRNQELVLSKDLIAMEHDFNQTQLEYQLNQTLFQKQILAKNEWEQTQEKYRYQRERKTLLQESLNREKHSNQLQLEQINKALNIMQKSLETLRENKKNFLVLAPVSGRLSSFEAILGQTYLAGTSIGKVDEMKGYKLMANIDEFYLEKIQQNQKGQMEIKGNNVEVSITKIIPAVKNGQFKAELNFTGSPPTGLQEGSSFSIRLSLSSEKSSVVLPKGNFYTATKGKWIFVVKGNKAVKRTIKLGRENPDYYEIITGLQPGEKVIVSNYEDYMNIDQLNIEP